MRYSTVRAGSIYCAKRNMILMFIAGVMYHARVSTSACVGTRDHCCLSKELILSTVNSALNMLHI